MKPIFKWMGGKRKMMPLYEAQLSVDLDSVEDFYDLFAGSLAASMWAYERMPRARIHINEFNPFLVGLYETVRDHTEDFIDCLYKNIDVYLSIPVEKELDKKGYRHTRKRYNWYRICLKELNLMWAAGLHLTNPAKFYSLQYLLQRVSFGGAWQTNKELSPTYATPSGSLVATEKGLKNADVIREVAAFLQDPRVTLMCGGYQDVAIKHGEKSLVFADPPYVHTEHKYGSKFTEENQRELSRRLSQLSADDVNVMMTNAPWSEWAELLPGFEVWQKDHLYTVGQGSVMTHELLISNCIKI